MDSGFYFMPVSQPEADKKYFTLDEANRMLPLVRAIVADIVSLYQSLRQKHEQLQELEEQKVSRARRDELDLIKEEFETSEERICDFVEELNRLGVEFKGFEVGLVDFPSWRDGHEVYLCWKLGEPTVDHWHEIWAGFAGRQPIR
jgi:hypothetical protein